MISTQHRFKDSEDVGVLFHALIRYAQENEARRDQSVVALGYGRLLDFAERAATEIAEQHAYEGDDWDGVVWFERLEDIGVGSLAEALCVLDYEPDVPAVVRQWMASFS